MSVSDRMKDLTFVMLAPSVFASCSFLGTTEHVYTLRSLEYVKNLGIGPYVFLGVSPADADTVYATFASLVCSDLRNSGVFQKVHPLNSLKANISGADKSWIGRVLDKARGEELDGVVLCQLELISRRYKFVPLTDAEVTISLYDPVDQVLLLKTQFNTSASESYWQMPSKETVIRYATNEAIRAFTKQLQEQRGTE